MHSRKIQLNNTKMNRVGLSVVYVMSRDQRVRDNHALLEAQHQALKLKLPLVVVFFLYEKSGFRAREQYQFMLEGLKTVESDLKKLGILFQLVLCRHSTEISLKINAYEPVAVFFDFSPLQHSRRIQEEAAAQLEVPVYVVDTHNIVPVWVTSDKQEYAARTIRPKIHRLLPEWLIEPTRIARHPYQMKVEKHLITDNSDHITKALNKLPSNSQAISWESGERAAQKTLKEFIKKRLFSYVSYRNDPTKDSLSGLSPYLHFGQISSLRVALEVSKLPQNEHTEAFLEELIVRKELADNFCFYNKNYLSVEGAPAWAQKTLAKHAHDPREYVYSFRQLEMAQTHDELWNAAQRQLTKSGKMHGYMRMYWAKKVLEWTQDPQTAIDYLIRLNDFYSIDGGDPNGYVGILWSVAGLHDRPWFNRPVYGLVRYMSASGMAKKFALKSYIDKWL
jgi:deoxyribodipyrimidine photo-lyase